MGDTQLRILLGLHKTPFILAICVLNDHQQLAETFGGLFWIGSQLRFKNKQTKKTQLSTTAKCSDSYLFKATVHGLFSLKLIGSAMFCATFNLVTRAGVP